MSSSAEPSRLQFQSGPTQVALVGAGFIADYHRQILQRMRDVRLVAVCDPNLEKAQDMARRFGIAHAVASIQELAGLGIQIAHVLTPPDSHGAVVRELLDCGIGAFVEKPLVLDSTEARELSSLAEARGVPLGVNHNAVYQPGFARLLKKVRRGTFGKLDHVQVTLSVSLRQMDAGDFSHWMFRSPRNIVYERGPHPFSQLNELIGPVSSAEITRMGARELLPGQVFHPRWVIAAEAEGGTAEIYFSFGSDFNRSTLQVLGSDGSIEVDLEHDQVSSETKTRFLDFFNTFLAGSRRGLGLVWSSLRGLINYGLTTLKLGESHDPFYRGMRNSIRAFYKALRAGRRPPQNGESAARVLEWCEAATVGVSRDEVAPVEPGAPVPPRPGEVVVFGSNGFIGRKTVEKLLEKGHPVTAVVRRFSCLPPVLTRGHRSGRVRLVRASLEDDENALAETLHGARAVIHLAKGGGDRWEEVERSTVQGTVRLAEACFARGVERLVFASSIASLYLGKDCGREIIEDDYPIDPHPQYRPVYARGKHLAEQELERLHRERGLPVVIVRPGFVMGPGTPMQHSGLGLWVRDNHCVGWGMGHHPLPFVHVDDVADALVSLVEYPGQDLHGRALNLCARPGVNAREMVAEMRAVTGRRIHFHGRPLWLSQGFEIGKWLVKKLGRRKDAVFPAWRDLKSRAAWPAFTARLAREKLGWQPVEDRARFLETTVRDAYGHHEADSPATSQPASAPGMPSPGPSHPIERVGHT